jgi:hypothetical protein
MKTLLKTLLCRAERSEVTDFSTYPSASAYPTHIHWMFNVHA